LQETQTASARPTRVTARTVTFQRLAAVTTVLTLGLVALGGAVRATGSGLACPDWPFCYGKVIPRQADIPPETRYTLWNVWLEHTHRLVASVVGVLVVALAVWAVARYRHRPSVLWPALAAVVLVGAQAGLGALVVLHLLRPGLVTAHLGLAMALLALLVYMAVSSGRQPPARGERGARDLRYARVATAVAALTYLQVLVGGHVTGLRAGLAYRDFPLMDGRVFPEITTRAQAYHATHRFLAYALAAAAVYLCARAVRYRRELRAAGGWDPGQRWLVRLPVWVAALVVVQIGLGVANLASHTAAWTVTPHLAVASWIWTLLVLLAVLAYRGAPARPPRELAT
jgi:heme A synthase